MAKEGGFSVPPHYRFVEYKILGNTMSKPYLLNVLILFVLFLILIHYRLQYL